MQILMKFCISSGFSLFAKVPVYLYPAYSVKSSVRRMMLLRKATLRIFIFHRHLGDNHIQNLHFFFWGGGGGGVYIVGYTVGN